MPKPKNRNDAAKPAAQSDPLRGHGLLIDVKLIAPSPWQPRQAFDEAELAGLAQSISAHGLLQPILVRETRAGYELLAGERRLRAAKVAGLANIPAVLRRCDDGEAQEIALLENLQRRDLSPIEEAHAFQTLLAREGSVNGPLTQVALAQRLGVSQSHIANRLRLLKLPEETKARVISGEITGSQARELLPRRRVAAAGTAANGTAKTTGDPEPKGPGADRTIAAIRADWLRWLVSKRLGDQVQTELTDVLRVVLLATQLPVVDYDADYDLAGGIWRVAQTKKRPPGSGLTGGLFAALAGLEPHQVIDLTTEYARYLFWRSASDEPEDVVADEDVQAIAEYLRIDLAAAWAEGQAGPLSKRYWDAHTKEELLALGQKIGAWKAKDHAGDTKAALVGLLLHDNKAALPAELAGKKKAAKKRK
jgi:ParB/RepB/Spo0J family partition protein